MPLRFDRSELQKPKLDQNGYLVADALVTRAGVFVYKHPDGSTTRELRHPDDVFKEDSLNSLAFRPVTDGHPYPGKLDAKNTKKFSIGNLTKKPEQTNEDFIKTGMMVTDQAGIDKIMREEKPVREVSCGYMCDTVKESGTFQGEKYDHRQKNIIYNHVAIVDKGRAGPQARLVLDAADGAVEGVDIELKEDSKQFKQEKNSMKTVKIIRDAVETRTFNQDAFEVEIEESAQPAVLLVMEKLDASHDHVKELELKIDELRGENDELKAKGDIPPERLASLAQERADLLGVAHHVKVEGKLDNLKDIEIKKLVVAAANPDLKLDDVSPEYIIGRYDGVCATIKENVKGLQSLAALRKMTEKADYLDPNADHRGPREKFMEDSADMWKGKEANA